ncbi:hypothetical protein ACFL35_16770 [Candidatus Riflebacteria bacterium]
MIFESNILGGDEVIEESGPDLHGAQYIAIVGTVIISLAFFLAMVIFLPIAKYGLFLDSCTAIFLIFMLIKGLFNGVLIDNLNLLSFFSALWCSARLGPGVLAILKYTFKVRATALIYFTCLYMAFLLIFCAAKIFERDFVLPWLENNGGFNVWISRFGAIFASIKASVIIYLFFAFLLLIEKPLGLKIDDSLLLPFLKTDFTQSLQKKVITPLKNTKAVKFLQDFQILSPKLFKYNGPLNFLSGDPEIKTSSIALKPRSYFFPRLFRGDILGASEDPNFNILLKSNEFQGVMKELFHFFPKI